MPTKNAPEWRAFSVRTKISLWQERHLDHDGFDELVADLDVDFGVFLAEGFLDKGGTNVLTRRG